MDKNTPLLLDTVKLWGIRPKRIEKSFEISGSPERTELRHVISNESGSLYLLESIFRKDRKKKQRIISVLNELKKSNLRGINPYIKAGNKGQIIEFKDRLWQLSLFIEGLSPKRPEYIQDKWRGKVLANFIAELQDRGSRLQILQEGKFFSLKHYVNKIKQDIARVNPELMPGLMPVFNYLNNEFINIHDSLKVNFCHGDFHPLNVIWGKGDAKAIIDWEFSGIKPEIYDPANLIGCLGIEHPDGLTGEFARSFIKNLKINGKISDLSWHYLLPFMTALRFAWLAEWLRKKDTEMIGLEIFYMKLIIENRQKLIDIWEI